jgi:hypothetical protein
MDILYKGARVVIIRLEDIQLSEAEQGISEKYWNWIVAGGIAFMEWAPTESEVGYTTGLLCGVVSSRWVSQALCSYEFRVGKFWGGHLGPPHPKFWVLGSKGRVVRIPAILLIASLFVAQ